jgi:hypothetical protein
MIGSRMEQTVLGLVCGLLLSEFGQRQCIASEKGAASAEAGETLLSAEDAEKALAELPALKNQGCLAARIVTDVDGLRPVKGQEGELLLD